MLQKGFLSTLADWTAEKTFYNQSSRKKALLDFGVAEYEDADDPEKIMGLFSEWLIFDYRQKLFDNETALSYFVRHNPLKLPVEQCDGYRDMLGFEVGLFEVGAIERGKGVFLTSFATGKKQFVYDINASMSLCEGDTIWTRIAAICGMYHCVGSSCFTISVKIMDGMRAAIQKWEANSLDASIMASFVGRPATEYNKEHGVISLADAERNFKTVLKRCGMDSFFMPATCKEWLTDEKKYKYDFAGRAVFNLIPDAVSDRDIENLAQAFNAFSNALPRQSLQGKTPHEAYADGARDTERKWKMDFISPEKYLKGLENAHARMERGEFIGACEAFEGVMNDALLDMTPFFSVFRAYANAGVCYIHAGYEALGGELFNAALRINPLYSFANKCRKKYAVGGSVALRVKGEREYKRSVFSRYEIFMKNVGISLRYKAKVSLTAYAFGPDKKKKSML